MREAGLLHFLAIDAGDQHGGLAVRDDVRHHEERAERAAAVEILARRILVGVALEVAHRAVIIAGIAGNMGQRVGGRDVTARLADDESQFAFIIELVGVLRLDDRRAMANLRCDGAQEKYREFGIRTARLLDMLAIIQANADDLAGVRDERQQCDV